jgi:hypothetical protein
MGTRILALANRLCQHPAVFANPATEGAKGYDHGESAIHGQRT